MSNPFETIDARLSNIENLLLDLKHPPKEKNSPPPSPDFKYIPIQDIFKKKICSKPTFYDHLKKGDFTLYKFGNKSFVDGEEFLKSFHKVKLNNKKGGNTL
jgi:hypothetical protein